jgi:hypothetical protein
MYVVSG